MAGNSSFDTILSTTLKHYTPQLEDNIFSNITLLYWLREAGHIEKVSGGQSLVEPLLYAQNGTAGSYSGYDNIATTPSEGISAAEYSWKQYGVTVAINGLEEAQNSSKEAIISLIKAKIDQAEMSALDAMNIMFYADGTGNSSKDWNGLSLLVKTDGTGTVGGIDASTETWWKNRFDSTSEALSLSRMSNMFNSCSKGKIKPEFLLTTQALYEKYEGLLQPQLRYQSSKEADAGFENLLFKSAPVMWDEDCNSGRVFFLNSKFLKLKVHSDVWFKNTPFEKPHGQDARYSQILCYGNLVTSNRRFLGVLSGKS